MRRVITWVVFSIGTIAAAGAIVFGLAALMGPVAERITPSDKDRAASINATRQTLLAAAAGTLAIAGLGFTARTYFLSRRGQLTDCYGKSVALLASDKLSERLGGIYALEHLMRESAQDHDAVVNVLAAFVREAIPIEINQGGAPKMTSSEVRTDVQAAVTVIGRRPRRPELNRLSLSYCNFHGIEFRGANLRGADLRGSSFRNARLIGCRLDDADLLGSNFEEAKMFGCILSGANLGNGKRPGFPAASGLKATDLIFNPTSPRTQMTKELRYELQQIQNVMQEKGVDWFVNLMTSEPGSSNSDSGGPRTESSDAKSIGQE